MIRRLLPLTLLVAALSACDRPAPREIRRADPPPGVARFAAALPAPPPAVVAPVKVAAPAPLKWNPSANAFVFKGKPLRAEKVWIFDGATDGFVAIGGEVQPGEEPGLIYRQVAPDPILRSPKGLNIDGANRSLVIVRMTRLVAGGQWDGSVFYSTPGHGEAAAFFTKPVFGGDPAVGETTILVFDFKHPRKGGADWTSSIIDQIRIDLDNAPGGEFLIRQVAVAQDPGGLVPEPAPPAKPAP